MNLPDIPILATATAVVISWALYALFCSYILEAWVQIKAERGRFMKNYLFRQLMDNVNGINWADRIYSYGTIDLLSRDPEKPSNDISPKLFAETLITVVGSSHLVQSQIEFYKEKEHRVDYQSGLLRDFKYGTLILNASDVVSLFKQAMNYAELKATKDPQGVVNEVELHDYLTEYFENWFNEFTQRLTLWYKKQTREKLFYLGAILGILINVDSLQLFSFYQTNPKAASDVVRFYKEHPNLEKDTVSFNQEKSKKELIPLGKLDRKTVDSLIQFLNLPCDKKNTLSITLRREIQSPNERYLDSLYNTIGLSELSCNSKLRYQRLLFYSDVVPDSLMISIVNQAIDRSANKAIIDSMKLAFANHIQIKVKNRAVDLVDSLVSKSKLNDDKKNYLRMLLKLKSSPAQHRLTSSLDSLIKETKLPIGWTYNLISKRADMDFGDYALKILGVLISGFAASFGAPFWFDLLKKATTKP